MFPNTMSAVSALGYTANYWSCCYVKSCSAWGAIFPPGATKSPKSNPNSAWRHFSFLLHAIQQALDPTVPLAHVLHNWNQIAADLNEATRNRQPQVNVLQSLS